MDAARANWTSRRSPCSKVILTRLVGNLHQPRPALLPLLEAEAPVEELRELIAVSEHSARLPGRESDLLL
jgi:hypothetical protein